MDGVESEERLSRKSSVKKNKNEAENGRKFKERVEEFQLWHDDETFTQLEYEKRRTRKKRQKGIIRSDRRLQIANLGYVPSMTLILLGVGLLLLSSVDGLARDTVVWNKKIYFQVTGAVLLAIGLVLLMVVAVYTYRREDAVRTKNGFPTLFEAARTQQASLKNIEESMALTCDFVDVRPSRASSNSRISRMTSTESKASLSNLGCSFSSNSTAMSWLHKHRREHNMSARKVLRRDNSDSALDTYFARKRILSWQEQSMMVEKDSSENAEEAENLNQNITISAGGGNESQALSNSSTASSGYHSNISSPTEQKAKPTFSYSRPFSESAATEQCEAEDQTVQNPTPEFFPLLNGIAYESPPISVPLMPSINIEYAKS